MVVMAYFSEPVGDLQPGDIQIRRVSDDELTTVENVVMSSDGMTATIQLVGFAAGRLNSALDSNTDYNLIVTADGSSASKVFSIPATIADATVYDVDPVNKTISAEQQHQTGGAFDGDDVTLTVPEDFEVDYQAILGTTITAQYDKNSNITKLSPAAEQVVYGAFKFNAAKKTFTDIATGKVYGLQKDSGAQLNAKLVQRAAKGDVTAWTGRDAAADDIETVYAADTNVAWAKLILNGSNKIKFAVTQDAWTGCIKVGEVKNNTVVDGKTEASLKDYVIIKDGETITTDDLEVGDVVYYNTTNSFAEVFNNESTGELENVYSDSFKFGGKEYAIAGADANITFQTKYSKSNDTEKPVDGDYLAALKSAGKDVTVRLNRANQAVFLDGETAEAVSSTKTVILTQNAKYYRQSLTDYIRIKGYDGSAVTTYDIDASGIKSFTLSTGKTAKIGGTYPGTDTKINKYKFTASGTDDLKIAPLDSTGASIVTDGISSSIATDLIAGELVTLTFDDKNNVTAIAFGAPKTGAADVMYGSAAVNTAAGASALVVPNADGKFRAGYTTINGLQLSTSAPVYTFDSKAGSVSQTTYGEFTGAESAAGSNGVRVYTGDGKNVSAIVVDKSALGSDDDGTTTTEGIVVRAKYNPTGAKGMNEFAILVGSEVKEYTKFSGTITTALQPGDIVAVSVLKDGETVSAFDQTPATIGTAYEGVLTVTQASTNTFKIGNAGPFNMATTDTVTYGKLENGALTATDLGTIIKEGASNTVVATTTKTASYIDTIVVVMNTNAAALTEAADAVSAALANLSAVMTNDGAAAHVTGITDEIDSAGDYSKVKAAYDNVTTMYETYKALDDTATNLATDFGTTGYNDPNVGDYALAATNMDTWEAVEATIAAIETPIENNTLTVSTVGVASKRASTTTAITWTKVDGSVAAATIATNASDATKKDVTVAIAANDVGTFKLVAAVTCGTSNTTVPYAVLCGEKGTTTNTIQSVSEIVDEAKYDAAKTAAVIGNFTPASLTAADVDTLTEITDAINAKAATIAALDGVVIDCSGLTFSGTEGAGTTGDKWTGNLYVSCSGYQTTIAVTTQLQLT